MKLLNYIILLGFGLCISIHNQKEQIKQETETLEIIQSQNNWVMAQVELNHLNKSNIEVVENGNE